MALRIQVPGLSPSRSAAARSLSASSWRSRTATTASLRSQVPECEGRCRHHPQPPPGPARSGWPGPPVRASLVPHGCSPVVPARCVGRVRSRASIERQSMRGENLGRTLCPLARWCEDDPPAPPPPLSRPLADTALLRVLPSPRVPRTHGGGWVPQARLAPLPRTRQKGQRQAPLRSGSGRAWEVASPVPAFGAWVQGRARGLARRRLGRLCIVWSPVNQEPVEKSRASCWARVAPLLADGRFCGT